MKGLYQFLIKPVEGRYDNAKKVGDKELIINTTIEDHKFVSKKAIVVAIPSAFKTKIDINDEVIVHHNIFRRWYDQKGRERNSASYFKDDMYLCSMDQIYLYKKQCWKAFEKYNQYVPNLDYCFIKPVLNKSNLTTDNEKPLTGIIKYISKSLESKGLTNGALITFKPNSEFEFIIDGERLYCMKSNDIVIEHEYQADEEEYNPSWANCS